MYVKDFERWNAIKQRINKEERTINARAGELRWISFGVNVGSEIDGKGVSFTRPGLIVHVFGSHSALVIPTTTKLKSIPGYTSLEWKDKTIALCIHQMRVVSSKRILHRIGRISQKKLNVQKKNIKQFFSL